jgi:hypothetical protein
MSGEITSFASQFVMGAIITQVLLLVISVHYEPLGAAGAIQDLAVLGKHIAGQLTATHLLLFGLFDCAGGLGFSAIVNGGIPRLFPQP